MKLKLIFAILVLAVSVVPACALTAGELQSSCKIVATSGLDGVKSAEEAFHAGVCAGFFNGFWLGIDGMSSVNFKTGESYTFAVAGNVTVEQMIHVYAKYVVAHPELENQSAFKAAFFSLLEARIIVAAKTQTPITSNDH